MKLLSRLANLVPRAEASSQGALVPSRATPAQLEEMFRQGYGVNGVFTIGFGGAPLLAYTYPVFLSCITLLSSLIAQTIISTVEVVDQSTHKRVRNSRSNSVEGRALFLLRESPDQDTPAYLWLEQAASFLLVHSNVLARVYSTAALPFRMALQDLSSVRVDRTENGKVFVTRDWDEDNTAPEPVYFKNMVHSYWGSLRMEHSDWTAKHLASPMIGLLRSATAIGKAGEDFVMEFFRGGAGQAPVIVTFDAALKQDALADMYANVDARTGRRILFIGNNARSGHPVVSYNTSRAQTADMAELRLTQLKEICRAYRVPPMMVGEESSSLGSNTAELFKMFVRSGFRQHMDRFLAGFSHTLLPKGKTFQVSYEDLTRGDLASTATAVQTLLPNQNGPGVISLEEARKLLGFGPEVDGTIPEYNPAGNGDVGERDAA